MRTAPHIRDERHPDGLPHVNATVRTMAKLASEGAHDYSIRQLATRILEAARVPGKDEAGEVAALFAWVAAQITYRRDPHELELVQSPTRTIEERAGDCDDMGTLLAALLGAVGFPIRFCTVGGRPDAQEHVWVEALVYGDWFAVDPVLLPEGTLGDRMPGHGRIYMADGTFAGPLGGHPTDPRTQWLWAAGDVAALTLPNYPTQLVPPMDVLGGPQIPAHAAQAISERVLDEHQMEHEAMAQYLGGWPTPRQQTLWTQGTAPAFNWPKAAGGMTQFYVPHIREWSSPEHGAVGHDDNGTMWLYSGNLGGWTHLGALNGRALRRFKKAMKKMGNWMNEIIQLSGKYIGPILAAFPATSYWGAAMIAAGQAAAAMEKAIRDKDWKGALKELEKGAEEILSAAGVDAEVRDLVAGVRGAVGEDALGDAKEILRGLRDEVNLPPEIQDWVDKAEAALSEVTSGGFAEMANVRNIMQAFDLGDDAGALQAAITGARNLGLNPDLRDPAFAALDRAADMAASGNYAAAAETTARLAAQVRQSFEASLAGTWTPAHGSPPPADLVRAIDTIEATYTVAAEDAAESAATSASIFARKMPVFIPGLFTAAAAKAKHEPHPEIAAKYPADARQIFDAHADLYRIYLPDAAYFDWVARRNERRTGRTGSSQSSIITAIQQSQEPAPATFVRPMTSVAQVFTQPITRVPMVLGRGRGRRRIKKWGRKLRRRGKRAAGQAADIARMFPLLGRPQITFTLGAAPAPNSEIVELAIQVATEVASRSYSYSRPLITRFQQAVGINADGLYGPATAQAVAYYTGTVAPRHLFAGGGESFVGPEQQPAVQPMEVVYTAAPEPYAAPPAAAPEEVPPWEQGIVTEDTTQPVPGAISEAPTETGGPAVEGYEEVAQEPVNPGLAPVGVEPPVEPAETVAVPVAPTPAPAPAPALVAPTPAPLPAPAIIAPPAAGTGGMQTWMWLLVLYMWSERKKR